VSDTTSHHILFYEYVPDILERRAPHRARHLERLAEAKAAGRIVMAGAVGDPPHGAVIVFRGVDPAEIAGFADGDPYMTAGLVAASRIERWTLV
jgi:uncharacterized protein YciI